MSTVIALTNLGARTGSRGKGTTRKITNGTCSSVAFVYSEEGNPGAWDCAFGKLEGLDHGSVLELGVKWI